MLVGEKIKPPRSRTAQSGGAQSTPFTVLLWEQTRVSDRSLRPSQKEGGEMTPWLGAVCIQLFFLFQICSAWDLITFFIFYSARIEHPALYMPGNCFTIEWISVHIFLSLLLSGVLIGVIWRDLQNSGSQPHLRTITTEFLRVE